MDIRCSLSGNLAPIQRPKIGKEKGRLKGGQMELSRRRIIKDFVGGLGGWWEGEQKVSCWGGGRENMGRRHDWNWGHDLWVYLKTQYIRLSRYYTRATLPWTPLFLCQLLLYNYFFINIKKKPA